MHFFSVVSACLLFSSLTAAGPLPRGRSGKLQFRQAAPFKNSTSTTDTAAATIEVVPVSLSSTPLNSATVSSTATEIISSNSDLSTSLTSTISSTSGFTNTTSPFSSSATNTAADVTNITPASPTATATGTGDGANAAQPAVNASQTAQDRVSSTLSGYLPSGSIVAGTGNFSRTLVSANSNTNALTDSTPTTGTQAFPFAETLTDTPGAPSTTADAPFTFSSDPVTPTTLSTRTTRPPAVYTVSGVGTVIPYTPSFSTTPSPLPTSTTDAPTTTTATANDPIIKVPTAITAGQQSAIPSASLAAVVAKNRDQANYYNTVFRTLTPDSRCDPNSIACIDGSLATCADGSYVLGECSRAGTACFAVPLQKSEGVYVNCENIETAERLLGLPNSLSVTIGSVPVVVPSTTTDVAVKATSVVDPGPTTTAAADAAVTAAAVQASDSDQTQAETDEETTVLHTTILSTITINVSDFAPSTVVPAADAATAVAGADGSLISIVPVAAAAVGGGESGGSQEAGNEGDGPVTVTVTRSVTVVEQVTVTKAGVTATVTVTGV